MKRYSEIDCETKLFLQRTKEGLQANNSYMTCKASSGCQETWHPEFSRRTIHKLEQTKNDWIQFCTDVSQNLLAGVSLYPDLDLNVKYQKISTTAKRKRYTVVTASTNSTRSYEESQDAIDKTLGYILAEQLSLFITELQHSTELSTHFWLAALENCNMWEKVNSYNLSVILQLFWSQSPINSELGKFALDILMSSGSLSAKVQKLGEFPSEKIKQYSILKKGFLQEIESRNRDWLFSMENQIISSSNRRKREINNAVELILLEKSRKSWCQDHRDSGDIHLNSLYELETEALKSIHSCLTHMGVVHVKLRPSEIFDLDMSSWISSDIPPNYLKSTFRKKATKTVGWNDKREVFRSSTLPSSCDGNTDSRQSKHLTGDNESISTSIYSQREENCSVRTVSETCTLPNLKLLSGHMDNGLDWHKFCFKQHDSIELKYMDPLFVRVKLNDDGSFDVPTMSYIHEIGPNHGSIGSHSLREEMENILDDIPEFLNSALVLSINKIRQYLVSCGNDAHSEEPWHIHWKRVNDVALSYIGETLEEQTKSIRQLKDLVFREVKSHGGAFQRLGCFPTGIFQDLRSIKKECMEEIAIRNDIWRQRIIKESQRLSNDDFEALQVNVWNATAFNDLNKWDHYEDNQKSLLSNIPATLSEMLTIFSGNHGRPFAVYAADTSNYAHHGSTFSSRPEVYN